MRKPISPLPTDCCGSGCSRCIFEIYEEHLEKYNAWKKEQEESHPSLKTGSFNSNNSK